MYVFAEPIAQGKAKAKVYLQDNPEIAKNLEAKLRQMLFEPSKVEEEVAEVTVESDINLVDEGEDKDEDEAIASRTEEGRNGDSDSSGDDEKNM